MRRRFYIELSTGAYVAQTRYLDDDIVRLYEFGKPRKKAHLVATLFWGDAVRLVGTRKVELFRREWDSVKRAYVSRRYLCALPKKARLRAESVLKVRFIDVGQGDGAIVETPEGDVIVIDGGEEEHFRRYVNVAYSHVLRTKPLDCGAIVVTHGDADHFAGLTRLLQGVRNAKGEPMVTTRRVFHNGLVKRPSPAASNARTAFGRSRDVRGVAYATELVDDVLSVSDSKMNLPFRNWKSAVKRTSKAAGGTRTVRLAWGDDAAFSFLKSDRLHVAVLGPIVDTLGGTAALRLLKQPGGRSLSASHTINGHSIVLKMTYGHVRFLFGADLNEESEDRLLSKATEENVSLTAEILKVPHHGSADFSPRMLEAVKPVVSIVSSGDENAAKEYIHPRAGLIGALGKYSRGTVDKPLVYVTEMVAFMARLGSIEMRKLSKNGRPANTALRIPNAYQKTAFGIVHVRTDGSRVLVSTHSGRDDQKESYAFHVNRVGDVTFEQKARIV
jgi:beta-lactamase superfamily II metal-dependent hydrolase